MGWLTSIDCSGCRLRACWLSSPTHIRSSWRMCASQQATFLLERGKVSTSHRGAWGLVVSTTAPGLWDWVNAHSKRCFDASRRARHLASSWRSRCGFHFAPAHAHSGVEHFFFSGYVVAAWWCRLLGCRLPSKWTSQGRASTSTPVANWYTHRRFRFLGFGFQFCFNFECRVALVFRFLTLLVRSTRLALEVRGKRLL